MTAARAWVGGAAVAAAALSGAVAPASAQQWAAEARVGRLDFRLAPSGAPPATSMALGLRHVAPASAFGLTAGVPLGEEDPLWAAVEGVRRPARALGSARLGIELAAQGFWQRYEQGLGGSGGGLLEPAVEGATTHGWGAAAQVLPFVAVGEGMARLEARGGGSFYRGGLDDRTTARDVALAELRLIAVPAAALAVTGEARHFVAADGAWTFAGVSALAAVQGAELWASVGRWLDETVDAIPWSAGATLRIAERLDLMVHAREDALDPLHGSLPRREWGAGLRVALSAPPAPAEPVPAAYEAGVATISIPLSAAAERPSIAGDFNGWNPEPMDRQGGQWTWSGRLEPGVYEYAFVTPDGDWFVPETVPARQDDGMGGEVALLVVEGGAR